MSHIWITAQSHALCGAKICIAAQSHVLCDVRSCHPFPLLKYVKHHPDLNWDT